MSQSTSDAEFEPYTQTSLSYDELRIPIGLDSLEEAFKTSSDALGVPVKELKLLDVGCGTGNYINAIKEKVGQIQGVEFNDGMYAQAKAKLDGASNVNLQQGSIFELEKLFEENTFDVVIMTQVIHHLTPDTHQKAIMNIARVLKPGGTFWIQTCTPFQTLNGNWWSLLIPNAATRVAERMVSHPVFQMQLTNSGMGLVKIDVIEEPLVPLKTYLDENAPFNENFRKSDSTWTLATESELKAGLEWWKGKIESGQAKGILEEQEQIRKMVGQTTSITSQKQK